MLGCSAKSLRRTVFSNWITYTFSPSAQTTGGVYGGMARNGTWIEDRVEDGARGVSGVLQGPGAVGDKEVRTKLSAGIPCLQGEKTDVEEADAPPRRL